MLLHATHHAPARAGDQHMPLTTDFSSSGLFAEREMAALFCWQTQHRSLIGFMMTMLGRSWRQSSVKVEYATERMELAEAASMYSSQMACFDVLDGRSFTSEFLYPGTRPGSSIALVST